MSEEQQEYDAGVPTDRPDYEGPVQWPPVTVRIDGPGEGSGKVALGDLLCHILAEGSRVISPDGTVRVMGYIDESLFDFVETLREKEEEVGKLKAEVDRLELLAAKERRVAGALESRLGTVTAQKLALAVAHGDVAPEQFENRRKIEVEGVRNLVAALRT